jgi:hypothetical protein
LAEQRPSRLDDAGLEEVEQFGVAFLFGEAAGVTFTPIVNYPISWTI